MDMQHRSASSVQRPVRWPYALGLGSALLGATGLVYAPFSGIVYALAIPGVAISAGWAIARRSPMRIPLTVASCLLLIGFYMLGRAFFPLPGVWPQAGARGDQYFEETAVLFLLVLPALGLITAVPAAAKALDGTGAKG